MAAPAIQTASSGSASSTAITATLPSGASDGDLIIVWLQLGLAASTTWAQTGGTAGWTEILDSVGGSIWYKQIGAAEANPSFDLSASSRCNYYAVRITGHVDPATTAPALPTEATATSAAPDPPTSTTPTASGDHLFIGYCRGKNGKADVNTYPAWNDHQGYVSYGHTLGGWVGVAAEAYLASGTTQDCGAFAIDESASVWYAGCVLVESAGASDTPIAATGGSCAVTGTAANLEFHRVIGAEAGSIALTGQDATLTTATDYTLDVGAGSYAITGTAANLEYHRHLDAAAGSIGLTGTDVTLTYFSPDTPIDIGAGAVAVAGTAANLEHHRVLNAETA